MNYTKPHLTGFAAMAAIRTTGPMVKITDFPEPFPNQNRGTDPAYQADE